MTHKVKLVLNGAVLLLLICSAADVLSQDVKTEREILHHGESIRSAFRKGDIQAITMMHHPEVIKALGYTLVLNGRDSVIHNLSKTLDLFTLEFIENKVENIFIQNDVAIEQTLFSIKGTPKNGGESFVFSGRTMATYVRYKKSPTGWATIREIIQQASN